MKLKPTEPRWTVNGNDYNPDLNKKPTENLEQLAKRFSKRMDQVLSKRDKLTEQPEEWLKVDAQVHYLRGCIDVVEYLATGKLPNDGNHDGMKSHAPHKSALQFKEKQNFIPRSDA